MTRADCIEIMPLHHGKVLYYLQHGDCSAGNGITVMTVYTVKFYLLPVQINNLIPYLNGPKTCIVRNRLVLCFYYDRIQVRTFRTPQIRLYNFQRNPVSLYLAGCHHIVLPVVN